MDDRKQKSKLSDQDRVGRTFFDLLNNILDRPKILSIVFLLLVAILVTSWIIAHLSAEPGKDVSLFFGAIKYVKRNQLIELTKKPQKSETIIPASKFEPPSSIYEKIVTNYEYEKFTKSSNRSIWSKNDNNPVVDITWNDARAYCEWKASRLLTEDEWLNEASKPIHNLYEWTATEAPNNQAVVCSSSDIGKKNCSSVKSKENSGTNITFRCQ